MTSTISSQRRFLVYGRIILRILSLTRILVLVVFLLSGVALADQKDGKLILIVTYGDIDNTPADHVIIHLYGYGSDHFWGKEIPIVRTKRGQYEATLQQGKYDVFVSEYGSTPRCRRVGIRSGFTSYWTLKLELDDVYSRGDVF
jgi:hypothetical protein